MRKRGLMVVLFVSFVLVFGSASAVMAYTYSDCPESERFFDEDKGCQVPIIAEYEEEQAAEVDLASVRGCADRFYDEERGCQVPYITQFVEEYAMVGETIEDKLMRGCPARFFNDELGCQVPIGVVYTP